MFLLKIDSIYPVQALCLGTVTPSLGVEFLKEVRISFAGSEDEHQYFLVAPPLRKSTNVCLIIRTNRLFCFLFSRLILMQILTMKKV